MVLEITSENFDIVFGNEASGLPPICKDLGESVVINHSNKILSYNNS